jgi:hypothetical protein
MNWIDIDKRLPKTYLPVLVFTESEVQVVACLFRKKNKTRKVNKFMTMIGGDGKERIIEDVTHWMKLPKDPV